MTMTLVRKELRSLLPLGVLVFLVLGGDLVYEPFIHRPDELAWSGLFNGDLFPGQGRAHAVVLLVLGLMTAYSLLPREHDEGTIELLYCLPVSRRRVFGAKILAALLLLWGGVLGEQVTGWLLSLPNPQSFTGGQFRLDVAAGVAFLHGSFAAIVLCWGVLLSFFRMFGLMLLGLAAAAYLTVHHLTPTVAFLDPTRLLALEYEGRRLVLPWGTLALHGAGALAALGAAWLLWSGGLAESLSRLYVRAGTRPVGKVVLGCGTAFVVLLGMGFVVYVSVRADRSEREDVHYESFEPVRAETRQYRFTYPLNLRERALGLVTQADGIHESIRRFLEARSGPPIVVDLTEQSREHAGIAGWRKIRMNLADEEDAARLARTFHHETVHALEFQESDQRMSENGRATAFFAEGLAEYVASRLVPEAGVLDGSRRLAVAAARRHRLEFEDLADAEALGRKWDGDLVYALGETWAAALVAACGDDAPGRVLRAMGRPDAPKGLGPIPFWQDTLRAAGYDLEAVNAAWNRLLVSLETEHRGFLETLPRLSGGPARLDKEEIVLLARLDRAVPAGGRQCLVRVRNDENAPDAEVYTYGARRPPGGAGREVELRVPRTHVRGRRFQFQFGLVFEEGVLPWFEAWQSAAVPR